MKRLVIFLLAILIIVPTIQDVSAETLFLTSDNLIDPETDYSILSSIANFIEEISNGDITVIVDSQAPGPGEGTRAITSSSLLLSPCRSAWMEPPIRCKACPFLNIRPTLFPLGRRMGS